MFVLDSTLARQGLRKQPRGCGPSRANRNVGVVRSASLRRELRSGIEHHRKRVRFFSTVELVKYAGAGRRFRAKAIDRLRRLKSRFGIWWIFQPSRRKLLRNRLPGCRRAWRNCLSVASPQAVLCCSTFSAALRRQRIVTTNQERSAKTSLRLAINDHCLAYPTYLSRAKIIETGRPLVSAPVANRETETKGHTAYDIEQSIR